jgi:mono/diheme cytochrome c family protein
MTMTAVLGVVFLALGLLATYLMFHLWGYPYDSERRRSSAPQWKMNIHRVVGAGYILVYIVMMAEMVPRLWTYQVEFPARTVVHLSVGIAIGAILLVKVSIIRWFRHLEELMPALGISLLVSTIVLTGLSLPLHLARGGLGRGISFDAGTRARLVEVLPAVGVAADQTEAESLADPSQLRLGMQTLMNKCTHCHDIRTVVARPRTPDDWARTVRRMAERPAIGQVISEKERARVAAYLIAITPALQESEAQRVQLERLRTSTTERINELALSDPPDEFERPGFDLEIAAEAFRVTCSQCHTPDRVEQAPPRSTNEVDALLGRMVERGLYAGDEQIELVREYLIRTYTGVSQPSPDADD